MTPTSHSIGVTLDRAARAGLTGKGVEVVSGGDVEAARASPRLPGRLPEVLAGVAYTAEELEPASAGPRPATPRRRSQTRRPPSPSPPRRPRTRRHRDRRDRRRRRHRGPGATRRRHRPTICNDHATIPKDRHLVASAAQLKKIHAACRGLGYTERDDVLRLISLTLGEPIGSSKDLTKDTASTVIDALEALERPMIPRPRSTPSRVPHDRRRGAPRRRHVPPCCAAVIDYLQDQADALAKPERIPVPARHQPSSPATFD